MKKLDSHLCLSLGRLVNHAAGKPPELIEVPNHKVNLNIFLATYRSILILNVIATCVAERR